MGKTNQDRRLSHFYDFSSCDRFPGFDRQNRDGPQYGLRRGTAPFHLQSVGPPDQSLNRPVTDCCPCFIYQNYDKGDTPWSKKVNPGPKLLPNQTTSW